MTMLKNISKIGIVCQQNKLLEFFVIRCYIKKKDRMEVFMKVRFWGRGLMGRRILRTDEITGSIPVVSMSLCLCERWDRE